jgi:hypothetical protein
MPFEAVLERQAVLMSGACRLSLREVDCSAQFCVLIVVFIMNACLVPWLVAISLPLTVVCTRPTPQRTAIAPTFPPPPSLMRPPVTSRVSRRSWTTTRYPPLPDSSDAEQQYDDPSSAVMSVAEQQDDDPKAAKKKHASAVMRVSSTTSTTRDGGGGGGGGGSGLPAALITALDVSRSTDVASGWEHDATHTHTRWV